MYRVGATRNFVPPVLPNCALPEHSETPMYGKRFALIIAACAAAVTLGCENGRFAPISSSQAQIASVQAPARGLPDFSALVEQYGPAVVNISTTARVRTQMQQFQIPGEPGDPFYAFFRRFQIPPQGASLRKGAGSAFIVRAEGYILTGGYMGLSFAVPIDVAMKVKNDLQKYGKVSRGRLGVSIQGVSQDLADSFGLKKAQGALVSAVEPKSPADKAGIKPGDIILEVDGRAIENSIDLPRIIGESRPGTAVNLKVWRHGQTRELRASLGEIPAEKIARAGGDARTGSGKLGLSVRPLTEDERNQAAAEGGLLVEEVEGAAARAGVQPGDVILALNNQPVKTADQLRRLVDRSRGTVALLIQREGNKIYVPIRLG